MKVIVIGGGVAGLCLGHSLKQASIPFHIYERDSATSPRAQGYRVRVVADGLHRTVPDELFRRFEATCGTVQEGFTVVDADTGEISSRGLGGLIGPPGAGAGGQGNGEGPPRHPTQLLGVPSDSKPYNVDRHVLRALLLEGLEEHVSFGKQFTKYVLTSNDDGVEDGGVEAHFSDGTTATGSLLIGADGSRSGVKRQFLAGASPNPLTLDSEARAILGRTPVSDSQHPNLINGISIATIATEGRLRLFTDVMRFDREAAASVAPSAQLPDDYIFWGLIVRQDVLSPEDQTGIWSWTPQQAAAKALELTMGWDEKLRNVFRDPIPDLTTAIMTRLSHPDSIDPATWAAARKSSSVVGGGKGVVTLVGDAAHTVIPVGGVGASSAFLDAADLADAVRAAFANRQTPGGVLEQIEKYELDMLARTKRIYEVSVAGGTRLFGMRPLADLQSAD